MHAETLREREAGTTTVCRMFSCQRRPAACAGCVSFFDIAWVRLDQDRAESRIPNPEPTFAGGQRSKVKNVPIPNTEVKPATADGTAWETVWESRSLPALFPKARDGASSRAFFCVRQAWRAAPWLALSTDSESDSGSDVEV